MTMSWKCPDCGMTSRKDPRHSLSGHMYQQHGKSWDNARNAYTTQQDDDAKGRECGNADMRPAWDRFGIYGCTLGNNCTWKAFQLGRDGIELGVKPGQWDSWLRAHDQRCSGDIVQIVQPKGIDMSLPSGADLIAAERNRQIDEEGWTAEHDSIHKAGELAMAAISYVAVSYLQTSQYADELWPFEPEWFTPDHHRTVPNLVKAGALIAAEIDRLQQIERGKSRG